MSNHKQYRSVIKKLHGDYLLFFAFLSNTHPNQSNTNYNTKQSCSLSKLTRYFTEDTGITHCFSRSFIGVFKHAGKLFATIHFQSGNGILTSKLQLFYLLFQNYNLQVQISLSAVDSAPLSFVWKAMYKTKATTTTQINTNKEYTKLADYFYVILVMDFMRRDELGYKFRYLGFFLGVEGTSDGYECVSSSDFQLSLYFSIKIIIKISIIVSIELRLRRISTCTKYISFGGNQTLNLYRKIEQYQHLCSEVAQKVILKVDASFCEINNYQVISWRKAAETSRRGQSQICYEELSHLFLFYEILSQLSIFVTPFTHESTQLLFQECIENEILHLLSLLPIFWVISLPVELPYLFRVYSQFYGKPACFTAYSTLQNYWSQKFCKTVRNKDLAFRYISLDASLEVSYLN